MIKKLMCAVVSMLLVLCVFSACDNGESGVKVNQYILNLEGTWEYTEDAGTIAYTFSPDGTGNCSLLDYDLPFTFSANETALQLITDYKGIYEEMYGKTFDELISEGVLTEQYRYVTENYTYILGENTLTITDTVYSQLSGSDIATLVLTKTE